MAKGAKLYEGKAKILYKGPEDGTLVQYFKDDATAFNAEKHAILEGKGVLNNRISEFIFEAVKRIGIPTHFIKRLNMREQLIKECEIIPLEVVVRNVAAGSMVKRLGVKRGEQLPRSIVEFYYKKDELGDPLVTEDQIDAFAWAGPHEVNDMISYALRINDFLSGIFAVAGLQLVDFKLEFGRHIEGDVMRLILADEISPDSCRLWDLETGESLDKDLFREDKGGMVEAYAEVAKRLGILKGNDDIIASETADKKGPVLVSNNDLAGREPKSD